MLAGRNLFALLIVLGSVLPALADEPLPADPPKQPAAAEPAEKAVPEKAAPEKAVA